MGDYGWRHAVETFALTACLIAIPIVVFVIVPRPSDVGQHPDGDPSSAAPVDADMAFDLPALLRDRNFWLTGFGHAIGMAVPIASLFLVRHMESFGVGLERASLVFIAMGAGGLVGKLVAGQLADRIGARPVALGAMSSLFLGWALLSQTASFTGVMVAGPFAGFGAGAMIPMHGMLIGACFDRNQVGRIFGLHAPLGLPFLLSISPLVGWLRDRTGSFEASFVMLSCLCLVSFVLLAGIRIPRTRSQLAQ